MQWQIWMGHMQVYIGVHLGRSFCFPCWALLGLWGEKVQIIKPKTSSDFLSEGNRESDTCLCSMKHRGWSPLNLFSQTSTSTCFKVLKGESLQSFPYTPWAAHCTVVTILVYHRQTQTLMWIFNSQAVIPSTQVQKFQVHAQSKKLSHKLFYSHSMKREICWFHS